MFKVDWDLYNNETEPDKKNMFGASDEELIKKKIITAIAIYIKNHKEKAINLLNKYGENVNTEEEIASAATSQLYNGTKDFRDDLSMDLMKLKLLDGDKGYEHSFEPISMGAIAIISGIATVLGGGASVWAAKIKRQQEQERTKQELLNAIAAQKSGELQIGSKQQQTTTIITALVVLLLIIGLFILLYKTRKNN